MSVNRQALIRYKILDNCFRNTGRRFYFEDLLEECNKVLQEIMPGYKGVSKRQLQYDIQFMESSEGWGIELLRLKGDGKKVYYRYADTNFSINNMPLNDLEIEQLQSAMEILTQFKGMPQFEWVHELIPKLKNGISKEEQSKTIIEFDNNAYLKGIEHLGSLYNAILYEHVLEVTYQSFDINQPVVFELHPYYLKQYNNRWFVFGYNPQEKKYNWNLALDRILKIKEVEKKYIANTKIDWEEYFEDIVGVTKLENEQPVDVILHFYDKTCKYVESKPLHGSQKSKWIAENTLEVRLKVIINIEFERLLMSYGAFVKVIEPLDLSEKVQKSLEVALKNYKKS